MKKQISLYLSVALLLSGLTMTNISHLVYADSNVDQLIDKFFKKCIKADDQKKADQSEKQAEHHGEKFGDTVAFCGVAN